MIIWQLSSVAVFVYGVFQSIALISIKEEWNPIWGSMIGLVSANLVASFIM